MGEYLRSALNTLSANWSNQEGSTGSAAEFDSELIGTSIELKGQRLRFERVISVGGFGYVFRVKDLQTHEQFALKRLIAGDKEAVADVRNEIHILNKLQTHAHIMRSFSSVHVPNSNIFYILTEFCSNGSLANLPLPLNNTKQLNRILYQTANAINHMHLLGIIHRDIKIENILFDTKGFVKLCDFGSATEQKHHPNDDWTAMQRSRIEDEYVRKTTPMYRPPEILDLYLNYPIDKPIDIWAFGCMLFLIRFGQHPFEDSSKLRILNCNYSIPAGANVSGTDVHVQLINSCLKVNPQERIKIEQIIEVLENNFVDLIAPCVRPKQSGSPASSNHSSSVNLIGTPGSAQSVSQAFSGLTKYLKDTSSKVMHTVQQSIAIRQDLDMSYLTSRLIAMSYPAEGLESTYRNHIDSVRAYLETRKSPYVVVNVSGRSYGSSKFGHHVKLINGGFAWKEAFRLPSLIEILCICDQLSSWVTEQQKRRLLVFHCMDGKINSAFMIAAFLLYIGMFDDQKTANNFFSVQRAPITFVSSQRRYLDYITKFNSKNKLDLFDNVPKIVKLRSITVNGIPLFTKNRDGCRPVVEIFAGSVDNCIHSSCGDYDELKHYNRSTDAKIKWDGLNVNVDSNMDVCVVVSHARAGLGARVLQGNKLQTLRICSVQFNLAMEHRGGQTANQTLAFEAFELDGIEVIDRYPREFQIQIELQYTDLDSPSGKSKDQLTGTICDPFLLFENKIEFDECKDTFNCQRPAYLINGAMSVDEQRNVSLDHRLSDSSDSPSDVDEGGLDPQRQAQTPVEADLLNLSINSPIKHKQSKDLHDDLFADFSVETGSNSFDLLEDIMTNPKPANVVQESANKPTNASSATSNVDLLEDLFCNPTNLNACKPEVAGQSSSSPLSSASKADVINKSAHVPASTTFTSNVPRNSSTPNLLGFDPFDQLTKLSTGQSSNHATPQHTSNNLLKPQKAHLSNSTSASKAEQMTQQDQPSAMPRVSSLNAFSPSNHNCSAFKPDYNRSYFAEAKGTTNGTGVSSKVTNNAFEDLLKDFTKGQSDWNMSQSSQPKSMAQMKKEEMLRSGTIDPLKLKVNDWKEGKKRNIRALLSTLHVIVWPECNWNAVGMHQLISENDVKKMYRKACLSIHPDKLVGSPHEELAKMVFIELNDAWNEFEKQRK